jgi:hypothetical protein
MKAVLISLFALTLSPSVALAAEIPPAGDQISAAILAAPEDRRAGSAVLGYSADGKIVTLRKGTNDLICLADDPTKDPFSVACYHKDLEPFMARGRELEAQGVTGKVRHATRAKEVEEGKLFMPHTGRTLYVLNGKGYDKAKGEIIDGYLRWVIYQPFATTESTGLTTSPSPGAPWLMYPGEAGAHIMISPPKPE